MPDLRPFEARSAEHLRLVIESGHIGIWELDLASGHAARNLAHDEIFGYDEMLADWTYAMFLDHVADGDRQRVDELQRAAIRNASDWTFQCEIRTKRRERRWISAAGRPLTGADGTVVKLIGHVIDITPTKEREARLALLTDELNHRVRNMLAVIQSIVRLSARTAASIGDFAKALEGRVDALARSHQLLVADASSRMTPSSILEAELGAFPELACRLDTRVADEPAVNGTIGQGLALVFHELITNALKYGAFSNDDGRVTVEIGLDAGMLAIVWKERGGPPVQRGKNSGFGSVLIEGALSASGTVDLSFPEDGAECRIGLRVD